MQCHDNSDNLVTDSDVVVMNCHHVLHTSYYTCQMSINLISTLLSVAVTTLLKLKIAHLIDDYYSLRENNGLEIQF